MSILLLPVLRSLPAEIPTAILLLPVVLNWSANAPMAVLSFPVVLAADIALKPMAVLFWLLVLL